MIRRRAAIETLCDFPEAKYVCEQSYSMQMRFNQEKCFSTCFHLKEMPVRFSMLIPCRGRSDIALSVLHIKGNTVRSYMPRGGSGLGRGVKITLLGA